MQLIKNLTLLAVFVVNAMFTLQQSTVLAKENVPPSVSKVVYTECWFEAESDWPEARCGHLTVPENYAAPYNGKVELPFVVFHPFGDETGAPLLVTGGGGPGNGLGISSDDAYQMNRGVWSSWYSSALHNGLSLILIDNRGVGSSRPRLDCHEVEKAEVASLVQGLSGEKYLETLTRANKKCKQRLQSSGVDLDQYHVVNAAKDIDELRRNLKLESLNLYGVSYGTRVALMYERLYPSTTRSLILDGVYPLFVRSHQELSATDKKTFDAFFARCRNDAKCAVKAGQNLQKDVEQFLISLDSANLSVTLTEPETLTPLRVKVTPKVLIGAIWNSMYDETKVARLPKIMRSIMSGGTDLLAELVREEVLNLMTVHSLDEGAYALYACYDEIPFSDIDAVIKQADTDLIQTHLNLDYLRLEKRLCEIWGRKAAPETLKKAIAPSAPTLIYSGESDPVTPPKWANRLHNLSENSWNVVWPNIAHGVMAVSACADWVATDFLNSPTQNPLNLDCVNQKPRFVFDF